MKKCLIIIALVLVIVSALFSGTMACYVKAGNNHDKPKEFRFTVAGPQHNTFELKLAPGESVWYPVTLTNFSGRNVSETDMDISATICVKGALPRDLKLYLESNTGQRYYFDGTEFLALPKNVKASRVYHLVASWSGKPSMSDAYQTRFAGTSARITATFIAEFNNRPVGRNVH